MNRQQLLSDLNSYRANNMYESAYREQMIRFIETNPNCFERGNLHGHMTGSAWVINPARTHVMLMHHKKLNRWFQPGGHADGEHNLLEVAYREALEETGLSENDIKAVSSDIFDIDIHRIPARPSEPEHAHYDIRYLFEANDQIEPPGNDESHQVGWVALDEVKAFNNNLSMRRMLDKIR